MIVAEWKEVGVLVGELIASQPPFVQICVTLIGAFAVLMFVEGLRANFMMRRSEPTQGESAPRATVPPRMPTSAAPHRIAAPATRHTKLRARAIKPHSAPRPKIRRSPAHAPEARTESFSAIELPQVASFEE